MLTRAQFKQIDRLAVKESPPIGLDPRNTLMNCIFLLELLGLGIFIWLVFKLKGQFQ